MPKGRKKPMLELTGQGDDGTTGLLGGGRVPKDDVRIEAYGTVDEASSAVGLAKALTTDRRVREVCEDVQGGLYRLGAELATAPDAARTFATVTADDVAALERVVAALEKEVPMPEGFVLPGLTPASGALDLARTITRRAERRCLTLEKAGGLHNVEVRRWLNRLSLLLFVLARYEEGRQGRMAKAAKSKRT